jgi:hypothetical protein
MAGHDGGFYSKRKIREAKAGGFPRVTGTDNNEQQGIAHFR